MKRKKHVNSTGNQAGLEGKDGQKICFSFTMIFIAFRLQYQIPVVKYGRENVMACGIYLTLQVSIGGSETLT